MVGYRWRISGRVQGVGFRWFIKQRAESVGVAGWVANLPDGRVEVVAAGGADAIAELETAVSVGPRLARVDRVEKQEIPPEAAGAKPFTVKHL